MMNYKTIEFNSEQLNKSIPKQLLNLIEDNDSNIRIIPTYYFNIIIDNLNTNNLYAEYNNDKDFIKIIDTLLFILNHSYQSSKIMEKEISRHYINYIRLLTNIGVIIDSDDYILPGLNSKGKCKKYYLSDCDDRFTIILTEDKGAENKLFISDDIYHDIEIEYNYETDYKLNDFEEHTLRYTKLNIELAILYNHNKLYDEDNYSLRMTHRLYAIIRFMNNKRYVKRSSNCNRLYTSFTELSSETRKSCYLIINNEEHYFHEIDMSNCAPTLLSNLLKYQDGVEGNMIKDCGDGTFYSKLETHIKNNDEYKNKWYSLSIKDYLYYDNYNDIKKMVCASILYGKQQNKLLSDAFYSLYAEEYLHINHLKNELSNSEFANMIMREEAKIFLDIDIPVYKFTTHDAIYFIGKQNESKVREEIYNRMKENFSDDIKYKMKTTYNNSNDIDVIIDDSISNMNIFILESKKRKQHKQHKQKTLNIDKVNRAIENGITKNKDISLETGLSLSTIKRIKKELK